MGWGSTKNGKLLDLAEGEFDVLLTADQRLTFQQNLRNRTLAVIVLIGPDIQIETMLLLIPQVLTALDTIKSGDVVYIGK
jgi:hypothetical protein